MLDLLAGSACDQIEDKYLALSGDTPGLTEGRLHVHRCKARRTAHGVAFELSAQGWRWIDREKEKLGAKFKLSQYVRFDAKLAAEGSTGLNYVRKHKVLALWFRPSDASADIKPLAPLDIETKSTWGSLLGSLEGAFKQPPEQQAKRSIAKKGSSKVETKLENGYTVVLDLCSGQRFSRLGDLRPDALPEPPFPPHGQRWLANERVRVRPNGVDLAGPFAPSGRDLRVDVRGGAQGAVRAQLICENSAAQVAKAFLQGEALPDVEALDHAVARSGEVVHLESDTGRCPAVLMTTPADDTGPVSFDFMAYSAHDQQKPLVPCGD